MTTLQHRSLRLRRVDSDDLPALLRVLETSDYTWCQFGPEELPHLLDRMPAFGAFAETSRLQKQVSPASLQAFLLVNWLVPPSAWLGGFGVAWSQGNDSEEYLDLLLPKIEQSAAAKGAHTLYYSGSNLETDWLRAYLEARNFRVHSLLRAYDKEDFTIPNQGNLRVQVRQFEPGDVVGTVAVEDLAFEQLWRNDAASFLQLRQQYPYFVVALDEEGIVGYQYNTVDAGIGYLVRIAVHPRAEGLGIGTRLMAEAVRYFQAHQVENIVLNTEEKNQRAQSLYLRFGFHQVYSHGIVLERDIAGLADPG